MKFIYIFKNLRSIESLSFVSVTVLTFFISAFLFHITYDFTIFLEAIIVMLIYLLFGYSFNNYCDRKNDIFNPEKIEKNPIAGDKLTEREGLLIPFILAILGISFVIFWFPLLLILYALIILNISLYSYKFKPVPMLGLISHGIWISALFLFPALILSLDYNLIIITSIVMFFISNIAQLENEIDDYKFDKKSKLNTTTVRFGLRFSKNLYYFSCGMLFLFCIFFYLLFMKWQAFIFSPLIPLSILKINSKEMNSRARYKKYERMFFIVLFISVLIVFLSS